MLGYNSVYKIRHIYSVSLVIDDFKHVFADQTILFEKAAYLGRYHNILELNSTEYSFPDGNSISMVSLTEWFSAT